MFVLGKIKISPNLVEYNQTIEDCIKNISENIDSFISDENKYLKRWICLKLIDGDEKIINSIVKHFFYSKHIDYNNINNTTNTNFKNNNSITHKKTTNTNNTIPQIKTLKLLNNVTNNSNSFKDNIISSILYKAESVKQSVTSYSNLKYNSKDRKIDKIITSKYFGIPIMLGFLAIIFWITIVGANYPSTLLSNMFEYFGNKISYLLYIIHTPTWLSGILMDGVYTTLTWVISVMLPPMAIFFPIFTLLEDLGFLPRIAFNLDKYFKKACSSR